MTGAGGRWRHTPEVSTAVMGNEAVLYDVSSERVFHLNSTGAAVWSLCDGSRSLGEVVATLAAAFDLPVETIRPDVVDLVRSLAADGLLTDRSGPDGH